MAHVGAGADQPGAHGSGVRIGLGERRLEQPVLHQLACLLRADSGALAELAHDDLPVRRGKPGAALAAIGPEGEASSWRMNAQRQELVPLQSQDRLQALHVLLAEQPKPPRVRFGASSPWSSRYLIFEIEMSGNSLWSRRQTEPIVYRRVGWAVVVIGEEGEPVLADLHLVSVLQLGALDTVAVENVPLRLPRSTIVTAPLPFPVTVPFPTIAWRRGTVTSSRKMSQSGVRPIVVWVRSSGNCSPRRPPPDRTTNVGPSMPSSSNPVPPSLLDLLQRDGDGRIVGLVLGDEQRAAA